MKQKRAKPDETGSQNLFQPVINKKLITSGLAQWRFDFRYSIFSIKFTLSFPLAWLRGKKRHKASPRAVRQHKEEQENSLYLQKNNKYE
jgi:hypothetical protein